MRTEQNRTEKILTYSLHDSKGFLGNIVNSKRVEIFSKLNSLVDFSELSKVLDVGVTSNRGRKGGNYFEKLYPYKEHITALSDQDASWLENDYPGLKFVKGDGRKLPFDDNSFDLVFSSAVIEHVGSMENQQLFINELCRVSKRYVFITTPNRWYPIEVHTVLPVIHWLPKSIHRRILRLFGKKFEYLANEENLNLLGRDDIQDMMININGVFGWTIEKVKLFGFTSNLLIFITK